MAPSDMFSALVHVILGSMLSLFPIGTSEVLANPEYALRTEVAVRPADTTGVRVNHLSPVLTPVNNQIWSVKESSLGWVFFAEEEGILAARGNDFQLIKTPGASTVRSLGVQSNENGERLYYGEQGDFGFVAIDSLGTPRAESLRYLLPDSVEVGNVWNVHIAGINVLFQARNHFFVFDGNEIRLWYSKSGFHNSFMVDGRYFIREFDVGLMEFNGDDLELVKGGELLKSEYVFGIVNSGNTIEVWTQSRGIYELSSTLGLVHKSHYDADLLRISSDYRLYSTIKLDDCRHCDSRSGFVNS